jgi:putative Holliday junction resolvase
MFAQPVGTFDQDGAVAKIRSIHETEGIRTVVIGWPLSEDGTENESTRRVDRFVRRIRNALRKVEVVRWDERYTTEEARDRLRGRGSSGEGRLDTAAAGIILQEFLDSRQGNPNDGPR